jgi:hypothetical protein
MLQVRRDNLRWFHPRVFCGASRPDRPRRRKDIHVPQSDTIVIVWGA